MLKALFRLQVGIEQGPARGREQQVVERRQQRFLIRGLERALPSATLGERRAWSRRRGQHRRERDGVSKPS